MNDQHFAFGENWQDFVKHHLNKNRVEEAKQSLRKFTNLENLKGKSFLDVGCGSGLFSLVAYQLGAKNIVSFDIDPDSIKCCEFLKEKAGNPTNWQIYTGSILDHNFITKLGKFDFVYAWGVLHHTGKMWKALENSTRLIKTRGLLYLAIYNKADGWGIYPDGRFGPSSFWVKEKKIYSQLPIFGQNLVDIITMTIMIIGYFLLGKNPLSKIREHKNYRGMSWKIDIKDWLGGYPYEYASVHEIFKYFKKSGFTLENLRCNNGLANNEFLLKREP